MSKIGILAYGSLIEDPGVELARLIIERINGVQTPFNIEFARKSSTRNDAPTLMVRPMRISKSIIKRNFRGI